MTRYLYALISACILFTASPALAKPLMAEDSLPSDMSFLNQNGGTENFASLKGENGLVLVFFRSADWCPFCQAHLNSLKDLVGPLANRGYKLAAASYDAPETLKLFKDIHKINYPLLSDTGSKQIKAFGIFNDEMLEGSPYYGIAKPTVYVIDHEGIIEAVLAEEDFKKRPDNAAILKALP